MKRAALEMIIAIVGLIQKRLPCFVQMPLCLQLLATTESSKKFKDLTRQTSKNQVQLCPAMHLWRLNIFCVSCRLANNAAGSASSARK